MHPSIHAYIHTSIHAANLYDIMIIQYFCVWNIWTEVKPLYTVASFSAFWFLQGDVACNQGPRPTKLPDCMGYRAWSALPTGSIFQFVWQAAKPITAQPSFHVCAIGAIWDCGEGQLYRFISLDILHWILVTGQSYLFPSSDQEELNSWFAARPMHSTSQFGKTSLSKCVTHVGSTRCRKPLVEYLSR